MLTALAWKNIWRNKKRSAIILIAIIFGLWGGLLSGGVMMGMSESMIQTAVNRYLAHIQIHAPDFRKQQDIGLYIDNAEEILTKIRAHDSIESASGRCRLNGMAASPTSTFGVRILGIDPHDEKKVTRIQDKMVRGQYFNSDRRNPIIIGQKLADRLNLKMHSKIVLSFSDLQGNIHYLACRIVGLFNTASSRFDEGTVYVHSADLFRSLGQPLIHEIAVRVKKEDQVSLIRDKLNLQLTGVSVQTWKTLAPELAFISDMMLQFTYLFVAIILFALLFGITNTMLMAVMERIHELGMLISIGMKRFKVFLMILIETVFLSISGGLGGMALGWITLTYFTINGLDLTIIATSLESFGSSTMLYPFLPLHMYLILTIMVLLASTMAALYPAWKAVKIEPAEAVRTEM
ncbi:MAG: FtsX-like permease family protein [Caldithrix sp.]|nr:FtsX-like permease family protein [Caldithrix sp.]